MRKDSSEARAPIPKPAALRGLDLLLLDVNVLLALAWPNHQFHSVATRRLGRAGYKWATCALTQLGFIRLSSNPAITGHAVQPSQAASLLARMVADPLHVYLPLSPPVEAAEAFEKILGYRQVTDAYLAAVAREHNARLLTFDTRARDLGDTEVLL